MHRPTFLPAAVVSVALCLQATLPSFADVVADYRAQTAASAGGDGTPVLSWVDARNASGLTLAPSNEPRLLLSHTPNQNASILFGGTALEDGFQSPKVRRGRPKWQLDGATEFTVAVVFSPYGNGESTGAVEFNEVAQLAGSYAGGDSSGFGIGYHADRVYFGKADSSGMATASVQSTSMTGNWFVAIGTWSKGNSAGESSTLSLALYDHLGRLIKRISDDAVALSSFFSTVEAPLTSTGFAIGESRETPDALNFEGAISHVRLLDNAVTETEEEQLALQLGLWSLLHTTEVTSFQDSGAGSLREAISTVNGAPHTNNAIVFSPGVWNIGLTSGEMGILNDVAIIGGHTNPNTGDLEFPPSLIGLMKLDAGGTDRVFSVANGVELSLRSLEVRNGSTSNDGGAIENLGDLRIADCVFESNVGRYGGAIYDAGLGSVTVSRSQFFQNRASAPGVAGGGGAIYSNGNLVISKCSFAQNDADDGDSLNPGGSGGAIFSGVSATISDSSFHSNTAGSGNSGGDGGAIFSQGVLEVKRSSFLFNSAGGGIGGATPGSGGAVKSYFAVPVFENCTFAENTAWNAGAAVSCETGVLRHCTVARNIGSAAVDASTAVTLENSVVSLNVDAGAAPADVAGNIDAIGTNLIFNQVSGTVSGSGTVSTGVSADFDAGYEYHEVASLVALAALQPALNPANPIFDSAISTPDSPDTDLFHRARSLATGPDAGALETPTTVGLSTEYENENAGQFDFEVTLVPPSPYFELVRVYTEETGSTASAGSDYAPLDETLEFAPGESSKTVKVKIVNDATPEFAEDFLLNLDTSLPTQRVQARGHILDNDGQIGNPTEGSGFSGITTAGTQASPVAGSYYGTVRGGAGAFGSLVFQVRPDGTFTARRVDGENVYTARGRFEGPNLSWTGLMKAARGGATAGLTPTFELKTATGTGSPVVEATFPLGDHVVAERKTYDGRGNVCPEKGRYTMLIPSPSGFQGIAQVPQGAGHAVVTVNARGDVRVAGRLGDYTPFAVRSFVSADSHWSLVKLLYRSRPQRGYLAGDFHFALNNGVSDFHGTLQWKKYPDPREKRYPAGFQIDCEAVGALYAPSTLPGLATLGLSWFERNVLFSVRDIPSLGNLSEVITWTGEDQVIGYGPSKLTARFVQRTGMISGAYRDVHTGQRVRFSGVLLSSQNLCAGVFAPIENRTGYVEFRPTTTTEWPGGVSGGAISPVSVSFSPYSANNVSVPFAAGFAGRYYGNLDSVGIFRNFQITDTGAFSSVFVIEGETVRLRGTFPPNGVFATSFVTRSGKSWVVSLQTMEDQGTGFPRIDFIFDDGASQYLGELRKTDFHPRNNPYPLAGRYTMVFLNSPAPAPNGPLGDGYSTIAINTQGQLKLVGALPDGERFSQTTWVSQDGKWDLYAMLYRNRPQPGSLHGQMLIETTVDHDMAGRFFWTRHPDARSADFPNGFTVQNRDAIACRYAAPPTRGRNLIDHALPALPDAFHNCRLVLQDTSATPLIEEVLSWNRFNQVRYFGPNRVNVRVNPRTGLVTGSLSGIYGITYLSNFRFGGVILQKQELVVGHHRDHGLFGIDVR